MTSGLGSVERNYVERNKLLRIPNETFDSLTCLLPYVLRTCLLYEFSFYVWSFSNEEDILT